jgi:hypothetical protein
MQANTPPVTSSTPFVSRSLYISNSAAVPTGLFAATTTQKTP